MFATGFLGGKHPGTEAALWDKACAAGNARSCDVLARTLDVECQRNGAQSCLALGTLMNDGRGVPRNPVGAARSFRRACELGVEGACASLAGMVQTDGEGILAQLCGAGDGRTCFMLGALYFGGQGVARSLEHAAELFQQSCTAGFVRGCGQLGESYLFGEGVPKDFVKARLLLESACDGGYAEGCFNAGMIYRQGISTPKNEPAAQVRFRQGCVFGDQKACDAMGPTASAAR
jgi:TPR repeat protein